VRVVFYGETGRKSFDYHFAARSYVVEVVEKRYSVPLTAARADVSPENDGR